MSPESTSSLYPDRPILPLPKRRLRERLSPDVADTIKYPPAPQTTTPLFVYPYNSKEEASLLGGDSPHPTSRDNSSVSHDMNVQRSSLGSDGQDSPLGQSRKPLVSGPSYESQSHSLRTPPRTGVPRHPAPQAPPSTASSVDGYDSFENSNNKKKRKIPTAGETILNGTHVLNDSSALGVPSPPTTGDEGPSESNGPVQSPYYQSGTTTTSSPGISGPGRGRYGRVRNGRSPLRALSDPNSIWPGRSPKPRAGGHFPSSPPGKRRLECVI